MTDEYLVSCAKLGGTRGQRCKQQLVDRYAPLCHKLARKYCPTDQAYIDFDDMVSSARFAVLDAIKRYNPNHLVKGKRVRFVTFVYHYVLGTMLHQIRLHCAAGQNAFNWISRIEVARQWLLERGIKQPDSIDISDALFNIYGHRYSPKCVFDTINAQPAMRFNDIADSSDSDYLDKVYPSIKSGTDDIDTKASLDALISNLSEREQMIIYYAYVLDMTSHSIAEHLGITAQSVGMIRIRALRKLRKLRFTDASSLECEPHQTLIQKIEATRRLERIRAALR